MVGLTFLACALSYTDRVNMAVAAVAMREQFGWSQTEKGLVLSSFFIGYMLFMFIGGLLSTRFGGKLVLGWSVVAWSVFTLLTPPAAAVSITALLVARIGMGLGEASMFPGAYELFGRWVPAEERARAAARMLSGIPLGTVIGLVGSGWLVTHYGWPSAFYVFGALGLVWSLVWYRSIHNAPGLDPRVKPAERALLAAIPPPARAGTPIPYRRLLLRAPVLAIITAHFATTWTIYVLLSWLPSYFRDVQGLSIANAGLFSAAPWLSSFAASNIAAVISDRCIARGFPVTRMRKVIQCGGLVACAALLLLLREAHSPGVALSLLCVAAAAQGVCMSGFPPGILDVAPRYSAVVYGFSNTFATIPGIIGVALTGWLVDVTGTYAAAFALTAAVGLIGAIVFGWLFVARPVVD